MTSGLTGDPPPVSVSGPCGWSRDQEDQYSRVQIPKSGTVGLVPNAVQTVIKENLMNFGLGHKKPIPTPLGQT
jgi:hypothetical protein